MKRPRFSNIMTTLIALLIGASLVLISYQNRRVEELVQLARDENQSLQKQVGELQMDNERLSKKLDCVADLLIRVDENSDVKRVELESCLIEIEQKPPIQQGTSDLAPEEEREKGGAVNGQEDQNDANPINETIKRILQLLGLGAILGGIIYLRGRNDTR